MRLCAILCFFSLLLWIHDIDEAVPTTSLADASGVGVKFGCLVAGLALTFLCFFVPYLFIFWFNFTHLTPSRAPLYVHISRSTFSVFRPVRLPAGAEPSRKVRPGGARAHHQDARSLRGSKGASRLLRALAAGTSRELSGRGCLHAAVHMARLFCCCFHITGAAVARAGRRCCFVAGAAAAAGASVGVRGGGMYGTHAKKKVQIEAEAAATRCPLNAEHVLDRVVCFSFALESNQ